MDLDTVRYTVTVLSFFLFAGICVWAYAGRNKARFDEAQQLPFIESGERE